MPATATTKSASTKPGSTKPGSASKAKSKPKSGKPDMPSDVDSEVGWFDRFADVASKVVSRAWFFAFCLLLVIVWAPSIVILHSVSIWQLIINTVTTIITFLLVALLQNTQERSNNAIQAKLNAIADALSDFMKSQGLDKDAAELRSALCLEDRESSDGK